MVTVVTPDHYKRFEFEPTLALVHLKAKPNSKKDEPQTTEEEVKLRKDVSNGLIRIFQWLKRRKVTRIIKLVVEESETWYCSEETVQKCLREIKEIRYLDWRRPDLSPQTFLEAPHVVELWLYSSGLSAVLSSWSDAGGLRNLNKVC
jgi:hypothetical protein